jgi:hypothetical protein
MPMLEQCLKANEQYAAQFNEGHLPLPPAKKLAVVACMARAAGC